MENQRRVREKKEKQGKGVQEEEINREVR